MAVRHVESVYQAELIKKIEKLLPDCFIIKNDPDQWQGIPDLLILFENKWAMLEVKTEEHAVVQPNQQHYINVFNDMSFASFIFPENEDEVLDELVSRMAS